MTAFFEISSLKSNISSTVNDARTNHRSISKLNKKKQAVRFKFVCFFFFLLFVLRRKFVMPIHESAPRRDKADIVFDFGHHSEDFVLDLLGRSCAISEAKMQQFCPNLITTDDARRIFFSFENLTSLCASH